VAIALVDELQVADAVRSCVLPPLTVPGEAERSQSSDISRAGKGHHKRTSESGIIHGDCARASAHHCWRERHSNPALKARTNRGTTSIAGHSEIAGRADGPHGQRCVQTIR
jgi:hypothetical protein